MKAKNQNKLTCQDKGHLLGLDIYFTYNKVYIVSRKRLIGNKNLIGSKSFREVIYREDREPGVTGIARINGQVKSDLFLSMFNSIKTIEKDGDLYLVALSIQYSGTKYNKFKGDQEEDTSSEPVVSPDLIKVNKEDKHLMEFTIEKIPGFFSKDYEIPIQPKVRSELSGSFHLEKYPFNNHWTPGSPEQMLVVKHLSEK